jgi:hypothetical protein
VADPVGTLGIVLRLRGSRRVPEIGPMRLENTSARADLSLSVMGIQWWGRSMMKLAYNICASKFLLSDVEHVVELIPHYHVGFNEDSAGLGGIVVDELLCLWTQSKISDHNIAVVF